MDVLMKPLFSSIAALPFLALGVTAEADPFRAVALTGSEALITHALSMPGLPGEAREERERFEAMRGYRVIPGVAPMTDFRIRPVLSFDPNVNGGVPNGSIEIAGFTFNIDPDLVGQSDILIGLEASGTLRRNIAEGVALDVRARGSFARAPRVQVNRARMDVDACLRKQVNPSRYMHGCSGIGYTSTRMGEQVVLHGAIGGTQAFTAGSALHAVTLEAGVRNVRPGSGQNFTQGFLRGSTASALNNGTAIMSSLELGSAVERTQVTRLRASLSVAREIHGRPTSIGVQYNQSSGGMFLGEFRKDHTLGLSVTRQFTDQITLGANLTQTRSNAQLFNTGPSLGFTMQVNF